MNEKKINHKKDFKPTDLLMTGGGDGYVSAVGFDSAAASVTYDHKAVIIDGRRRILISGSIHYPRSTPEMWPGLIQKAKDGGLDVIQTYVFWNGHEPSPGQYYFGGRFDLVRFIKLVKQADLYVHLRIGPYVCAEWNFGGFPVWLKYVPGISFRTDNGPFKAAMQKFTEKIVSMMKAEGLFESQGGPIILSQIENEFGPMEYSGSAPAKAYAIWAANMAVGLKTGVPWVMCKQDDAPDPVINTCNGFYCDYFSPNKPYKPTMWTEAWTGWYSGFGGAVPHRPVEDLAFAVTRFIQKGGSFVNYYMYHGGTNFGRTAGGPFISTSYDYDAPIDEYGLFREPKWGHLRDLHRSIKLCEPALIFSDPVVSLGHYQQSHVFRSNSGTCAAFLSNYDSQSSATVTFNGMHYNLPPWSISILPDCKTTVFNTARLFDTNSVMGFWENINLSCSEIMVITKTRLLFAPQLQVGSQTSLINMQMLEAFPGNRTTKRRIPSMIARSPKADCMSRLAKHGTNQIICGNAYGKLDNPKLLYSEKLGPVILSGLNEGRRDLFKSAMDLPGWLMIGVKGEHLSLHSVEEAPQLNGGMLLPNNP
ncbi:hypothetical protein HPP92_023654 [Vanilla planifolia]|uniref:beta-galactosidase n=1 Tax=Vanilla planifolia TaxID=51239 RepID=A0A835PPB1_VANPL|nr:hypothetical protein HPP92_023654 [Vanilla planifolia]